MDFGIAKQVGEGAAMGATATGMVVGTPEYMSPEQARGEKIDHRCDVYALGIVTFELFTGRLPFRGETPIATIFKHLQEPPPLEGPDAPPLPAPLIPVLKRALAKTPDERYSSAAEFAAALAEARDEAGVARLAPEPLTPRPSATAATLATPRTVMAPGTAAPATRVTPASLPTAIARPETRRTPRPGPPPVPQPPRRRFPTGLVATLAVVALVLIGGALLLLRGRLGLAPSAAPSAAPSPSSASLASSSESLGTLVIDALPWGEVVSITDSHGARHEPPGSRFTPLALPLPPGDYTIEVRNTAFAAPLSATVTVRAAQAERRLLEFRRVDAADYFKKTGL
jgi:serine/threonine-protein kinase